jgi:hypothetical protein
MHTKVGCLYIHKYNIRTYILTSCMQMITTTVSTAMSSEAADTVYALLDGDSDGKLTPEEITQDFCGQVLLGTNLLGSAAPLLNEIRAKDDQIAYLQAQIAKLGGKSDFKPLELYPDIEFSVKEFKDCLQIMKDGDEEIAITSDNGIARSFVAKCMAVSLKLSVKMFLTVANIPKEDHDKNSFFTEMKTRATKFHKDVVAILRPFLKVLPKGDDILSILDKIETKMSVDGFNQERKAFTDALFDFIDVDKDGKITPAEYAVYTDLFFKMTVDDDGAKAKLMAIFSSVDLDKSGCLSKGELSAFMINLVDIIVAYTLLLLAYVEVCMCMRACVCVCVRVRAHTYVRP